MKEKLLYELGALMDPLFLKVMFESESNLIKFFFYNRCELERVENRNVFIEMLSKFYLVHYKTVEMSIKVVKEAPKLFT